MIREVVSGDPGCSDASLADNAVRIGVSMPADVPPTVVYVLNFRNQAAYEAAAAPVEACRLALVAEASGPISGSHLEVPPYRAYGVGWTDELTRIVEASLGSAARGEAGR